MAGRKNSRAVGTPVRSGDAVERNWIAALEYSRRELGEPVPPGWLRRSEVGKLWGLKGQSTDNTLKKLVAAGKAEKPKFRVHLGGSIVRRLPHWRLKP